MPTKPGPLPDYAFDERLNRGLGAYRNLSTGRIVPRSQIITELENVAKVSRANMRSLSERLIAKQITIAEWQTRMAAEIKTVHVTQAAAAKGGWAQMSQADWGHVGYKVREQYKYLQGFANDIASGKQPLNGRVLARAEQYGKSGHGTFESVRGRVATSKGLTRQRRVQHSQEGCAGCKTVASLGWQPIGSLPPIGSQECRSNCLCSDEYE